MITENPDVDLDAVAQLLREHYGQLESDLVFTPLGADSWSYRSAELWVSVRRDRLGHVETAYEAATVLREQGLDFVLAPLRGRDGRVVHRAGEYPVVVAPYLDGIEIHSSTAEQCARLAPLVAQVHAASADIALPRETYALPFAADLTRAVEAAVAADAATGPYSGPLHDLIRGSGSRILASLRELQELGQRARADETPFVVTHGEPIGNILSVGDEWFLLDWGGAALGPPERDWWDFVSVAPATTLRPDFMRFYDLSFTLGEIEEYTSRFLGPHTGDADDARMWADLGRYVELKR